MKLSSKTGFRPIDRIFVASSRASYSAYPAHNSSLAHTVHFGTGHAMRELIGAALVGAGDHFGASNFRVPTETYAVVPAVVGMPWSAGAEKRVGNGVDALTAFLEIDQAFSVVVREGLSVARLQEILASVRATDTNAPYPPKPSNVFLHDMRVNCVLFTSDTTTDGVALANIIRDEIALRIADAFVKGCSTYGGIDWALRLADDVAVFAHDLRALETRAEIGEAYYGTQQTAMISVEWANIDLGGNTTGTVVDVDSTNKTGHLSEASILGVSGATAGSEEVSSSTNNDHSCCILAAIAGYVVGNATTK